MTKKEIESFGFYVDGKVLKGGSNRVYHEPTDTDVKITGLKEMKAADFINKIYSIAFDYGKKAGEANKMEEIKKALGIEETIMISNGYRI